MKISMWLLWNLNLLKMVDFTKTALGQLNNHLAKDEIESIAHAMHNK